MTLQKKQRKKSLTLHGSNLMRGIYSTILQVLLCSILVSCASAGSLVEAQLSTLKEINVVATVPRYEPIPGLTPDALEQMIVERVAATAKRNGLLISSSSRQVLVITVKVTRQGTGPGPLALLVLCELREPAVLIREWVQSDKQELEVTSWRESRLVLSFQERALDDLMETVELEAKEFAQKSLQARETRKPVHMEPNPRQ